MSVESEEAGRELRTSLVGGLEEVQATLEEPGVMKALLEEAGRRHLEREVGERMRRAGREGCGDEARGGRAGRAARRSCDLVPIQTSGAFDPNLGRQQTV